MKTINKKRLAKIGATGVGVYLIMTIGRLIGMMESVEQADEQGVAELTVHGTIFPGIGMYVCKHDD